MLHFVLSNRKERAQEITTFQSGKSQNSVINYFIMYYSIYTSSHSNVPALSTVSYSTLMVTFVCNTLGIWFRRSRATLWPRDCEERSSAAQESVWWEGENEAEAIYISQWP